MSQPTYFTRQYIDQKDDLADLIIDFLEQLDIKYIFGVPGGSIEPLFNAMARSERRGGLRPIVARHESGAAFMAAGYARETGKIGVCCSTTGPGATNLVTGVASAYIEQLPLLVITAQTALHLFGRHALQESSCTAINTVDIFRSCTRYSSLISHRGQLEEKLIAATTVMKSVPSGPVHLSIPTDILASPRRMGSRKAMFNFEAISSRPKMVDPDAFHLLVEELANARKTVFLLGDGCHNAVPYILSLAEQLNASIVTGPSGKRWMDHRHPLYRGVIGYAGHASADEALQDPENELVLAIGTRLGDMIFGSYKDDAVLNEKIIHIDNDPEHFSQSLFGRLHLCGAVDRIFQDLSRHFLANKTTVKAAENSLCELFSGHIQIENEQLSLADDLPLKPQRLMRELSHLLPDDARIYIDAGNSWAWATHYLQPKSSGLYRVEMGYGSMTWGIGSSIGCAVASPDKLTICITGDGSYLMAGQELTVAVTERLPVVFVILNDSVLGMVMHGQRLGGGEAIGFEMPTVDFAQIARAMGAEGITVKSVKDLQQLDFEQLSKKQGPTVIDVYIDREEIPPMGARMRTLGRGK